MMNKPQSQHQWLEKLLGTWTFETVATMSADKPVEKFGGTETVRSLGGLWVICEGRGEMPGGGSATTMMTLGFDPAKDRFLGTFVASMMSHLWIYNGRLNEAGTELTLDTEGPSFAGDGKTVRYTDVIIIKSNDHRVLASRIQQPDGSWQEVMTGTYRRTS